MKSIKKCLVLGLVLISCFSLCSCSVSSNKLVNFQEELIKQGYIENIKPDRFFVTFEDNRFAIFVDTETGVQYLVYAVGYKGGVTVLLDSNGKPLLYTQED